MQLNQRYYLKLAAAYIRGVLPEVLAKYPQPLNELSEEALEQIFQYGKEKELKIHKFKKTMGLPRVQKVLGMLQGLQPANLLDVGTGRGVFLWPLLTQFPHMPVQCVDILDFRVEAINQVNRGGIPNVSAQLLDITNTDFRTNQFDVVTALEVVEHIPNTEAVIRELCRVAHWYVIISVPSKEDDNPEHIHLFTKQRFKELFAQNGVTKVKFDEVLNHLIVLAVLE